MHSDTLLDVNEVSKWYSKTEKHNPCLKALSFTVKKGEKVLITGKNGSGKTTLLKILSGLTVPSQGRVSKSKPEPTVSFFYGQRLLSSFLTLQENLDFACSLFGVSNKKEAIKKVSATWQLEPLLHKTVGGLSTGQKVRASLACALAADTDLVLLDEPFAYLDSEGLQCLETFLLSTRQALVLTCQNIDPLKNPSWKQVTL